ncbi:hypothetical protein HanRHA438_Chr13g0614641 [Helianthus annuus]|nr:hypothetical protein HanRHA438_Chr13g0614641 [Helianthus annuus]
MEGRPYTGDAVYTEYKGDTIGTHLLKADDPDITFMNITIEKDEDLEYHFRDHVRMQIDEGKPVELYHTVRD